MLHTILHVLAMLFGVAPLPGPAWLVGPATIGGLPVAGAIAPLIIGAAMAGGSLLGGLLGNRRSKEEKAAQAGMVNFANQQQGMANLYGGYAQGSRASYLNAINSFDPASYLTGETQAVSADITDALNQGQGQRNRSNAARGLYGGSIGTGALNRSIGQYTARESARLSTTAGQMQMGKIGMYGNLYGSDQAAAQGYATTAADAFAGNRDYEAGRRQARAATWQNALGAGGQMYGMAKGYGF